MSTRKYSQTRPQCLDHSRNRLARWSRAHNPLSAPAWTRSHTLILIVLALLTALMLLAPGLLADVGRLRVGSYEHSVMLSTSAVLLNAWALLGVRAMGPGMRWAHLLTVVGLTLRAAEVRMGGEDLILSTAVVLTALIVLACRTIVRPNETERLTRLRQGLAED
ncbi:hypothetical protein [Deinococcus arenicola]|uniref:DUF3021 domain-containing protein n=1 Tax=Deinococcus arenicola TaxID=2994950 RepID=A0ABU4DWU3_9DEIO|nr:hypothetical protein [Deinococcus sp. ZS9-10]MDV6376355.1 hypothetical protein [Deinococcus sp. ZS9-10]